MFERIVPGVRATAVALTAAAVAVTMSLAAGTAAAATSWNAQYSAGDIVGAHAWGTVDVADRVFVKANIKDTAGDSHGARLYLRATYSDGGVRNENLSASGSGVTNSTTWNFAGNVVTIEVQECLTEGGSKYACASGWHTIY